MKFFYCCLVVLIFSCVSNASVPTIKPDSWKLVWQEEFDYSGLPDPGVWSFETYGNSWGWGNGEDQYYTANRLENALVSNGTLKIKALHEDYVEPHKYTSARINSKKLGGWKYGRIEVRAKLPKGQGIWPAIWMLPVDYEYGGWPDSGEIDIMEYFSHLPGKSYSTIHTKEFNHKIGSSIGDYIRSDSLHDDYHLYSVNWYSNRLEIYFDDSLVMKYVNPNETFAQWPFDKPFHLLLNCAVGGDWIRSNGGIDNSIFPQVFEVDYVRVYEAVYSGSHKLEAKSNGEGTLSYFSDSDLSEAIDIEAKSSEFASGESVFIVPMPKEGYAFQQWIGDVAGSNVPLEVIMGRDKEITAVFVQEGELIRNGDFSQELSGWDYWFDKDYASTEHYTDLNTFVAKIKKSGEHIWQAQLNQNISIDSGENYIVSFEARGSVSNANVGILQSVDPYNTYWANRFHVENKWNKYSYNVKLAEVSGLTRLEFDFGNSVGSIELRNISVYKDILTK